MNNLKIPATRVMWAQCNYLRLPQHRHSSCTNFWTWIEMALPISWCEIFVW